jgi:hypothetical protein
MSDALCLAGVDGTFAFELRATSGALVTPAADPVMTIRSEDGSTVLVPAQTLTGDAGSYVATYPATLPAGIYSLSTSYQLVAAGPTYTDTDDRLILTVLVSGPATPLVTLTEVKEHLLSLGGAGVPQRIGAAPASQADDRALQALIDAATPVIEYYTGPLTPRPVTETHDGDGDYLMLRRYPVVSVLSVTEWRSSSPHVLEHSTTSNRIDGYQLDPDIGEVRRVGAGGWPRCWWPGQRNVEIVYTAGQTTIPPNAKHAARELVAHWWRQRRGGTAGGLTPAGEGAFTAGGGMGYGVPNRVLDILGPTRRAPELG